MKRFITAFFIVAMIMSLMSTVTHAAGFVGPIGDVQVPYAKTPPTLDGIIGENEWDYSKSAKFDVTNAVIPMNYITTYSEEDFTLYVNMYYMWDADYLYVAYDVHDPHDLYDAYKGNFIRLYLDPNGTLLDYGKTIGDEAKYYMPLLAMFQKSTGEATAVMQRVDANNGTTITFTEDMYKLADTDYGWKMEVKLPWKELESSLSAKTGSTVKLDVKAGLVVRAAIDYYDVKPDGTRKGFLVTYPDAANMTTALWQYSKNAAMFLKLVEAGTSTTSADSATTTTKTTTTTASPDTFDSGMFYLVISASICVVSMVIVITKKKTAVR